MFKLIAVRVLEGCRASAKKCLKVGKFYYLCNDYLITDKGISLRDEYVRPLPNDFFTLNKDSCIDINISAIVGMNGDGKSSLIELIMRLINNCAKSYKLADRDKLLRIEGIKAELYYLVDDTVYCIKEEEHDKKTKLLKYADISDRTTREWENNVTPIKRNDNMKKIFYTIISNYSLYAYNTNDFEDEWNNTIATNNNDEKCWLHYLFHKNDGYRTPLTIHPFRYEGNIDINRETELTMQRLMALYIQEPNCQENSSSFRKIGNKEAEILKLTCSEHSKLHETTITQYFTDNKTISALKHVNNQIETCIEEFDDIIVENLKDNTLEMIKEGLDLITGQDEPEYKEFIIKFKEWSVGKRKLFSSNSDLRLLLNALKKFNNFRSNILPFHLFARKYKKYDKLNMRQLTRLRLIYEVIKYWSFPLDIVFKEYNDLSNVERCYHYIIYKTIAVMQTYPEYRDALDRVDEGWNHDRIVLRKKGLTDIIDRIKADKTHVTLKLRQCLNFINFNNEQGYNIFEKLDDKNIKKNDQSESSDVLFVRFDSLKSFNNQQPFPLELLPPPIYKADILYSSDNDKYDFIPYMYLSSGEKQLLNNFGALIYHLRNLDSVVDKGRLYESVNVFFEEIELYFHPEYQRLVVKMLIEKLENIVFDHIRQINITFITHSPFILSDIPICNVLFLKGGMPAMERMQENTFGSNIHGMLTNGFFLPSLPIGEFAHEKINNLFERLNGYKLDAKNYEQREWFYSTIMRVGEPYLRDQLMRLYNMHYPISNHDRY